MSQRRKVVFTLLFGAAILCLSAGCGKKEIEDFHLEGSCHNILSQLYEEADIDDTMREKLNNYIAMEVPKENEEYLLGTDDISYTDSVVSAPMANVDPFQCVLLRVSDYNKIDDAKRLLADNADPRKWVCVEAESTIIESVGDVILYIMADKKTAEAVREAFLSL